MSLSQSSATIRFFHIEGHMWVATSAAKKVPYPIRTYELSRISTKFASEKTLHTERAKRLPRDRTLYQRPSQNAGRGGTKRSCEVHVRHDPTRAYGHWANRHILACPGKPVIWEMKCFCWKLVIQIVAGDSCTNS